MVTRFLGLDEMDTENVLPCMNDCKEEGLRRLLEQFLDPISKVSSYKLWVQTAIC